MVKESDQELFRALKEGSETTFKKVYQDNRLLFLNFARKYGLNEENILDIYQDAYIAFHENIHNGKLLNAKKFLIYLSNWYRKVYDPGTAEKEQADNS